jgi:hypothetical protein
MLAPGLKQHLPEAGAHWLVVAVIATLVVGLLTFLIIASIAYLNSDKVILGIAGTNDVVDRACPNTGASSCRRSSTGELGGNSQCAREPA